MNLSIRKKIIIFTVIPVTLIYNVIFLISLYSNIAGETRNIESRLRETTASMAAMLDRSLYDAMLSVRTASTVLQEFNFLSEHRLENLNESLLRTSSDIAALGVIWDSTEGGQGTVIVWREGNKPGQSRRLDDYPGLKGWFEEFQQEGRDSSWSHQLDLDGTGEHIGFAYAVHGKRHADQTVTFAFIPLSVIQNAWDIPFDLSFRYSLINDKGELISSSGKDSNFQDNAASTAFNVFTGQLLKWMVDQDLTSTEALFGEAEYLAFRQALSASGWQLVAATPKQAIINLVRSDAWLEAAMMVFSLFMIVVSVWFVTGRITRPIRKLDRAMARVASGRLDTRISVRSDDEVGKLARRFSEMTSQLVLREQAERNARKISFDRIVQGLSGHYYYYSHDIDGLVKYVSPSVQDVLGLTPEEYTQHYTKFYTDSPANQQAIDETQRVISQGVSGIYEVEMYGGDGAAHHIEMVKVPVYDFKGKIIGVEGMGRDISDRVSDTARFKGLLESAPDAIVITDGGGIITVVNAQAEAMLGYVRSSLVGQPVTCLFPEKECERQPLLNSPSLEILRAQAGSTIELRARKSSGHTLPVEMAFSPIETLEGLLISISLRDISDRHAAERALRLSEERYRRMIEGLQQECIFYTQRVDGTFVYVTDSIQQILGYTAEEFMIGSESFLHRDSDRQQIAYIRTELAKGNPQPGYEIELVRADGTVCVLEVLDTPAFNERGQVTAIEGLARDRTSEKNAARALAEARDQAEAANKAKSLFLSNMSHELRTPLNGVLGYAQLLLGDRDVTSLQHERLMAVQTCGQHLLTLINDILDLTKIEAGEMELHYEVTSLTVLVETVEQILYQKAEKAGLKLEVTIRSDVPRCVYADETKLRQILINLVGNAIKFTKQGRVSLTVFMADNELACEVLDTGIGISPDHLEHIFEPFRQGEAGRREGGTGLGLSISRRLATTMGGNLTVISKPGKGSCFTLTLPLKSAEGDRYCPVVKTLAEDTFEHLAPGQNIQVMVVDDSTTNRDILKQMLTTAGLNVLSVSAGREAIALAQRYSVDLVLMDLRMSGMSGFRAAHTMKARMGKKCPPIVAISAGVYPSLPEIIKRWGFVDFIGKPFRVHELFQVIRRHLNAVWLHAESHHPSQPADALPALSAEQASVLIERLADAMEMGDVETVRTAAIGLTDKDQAVAFWANRILEYCDSLALDQLEKMLSQLTGLCEKAAVE